MHIWPPGRTHTGLEQSLAATAGVVKLVELSLDRCDAVQASARHSAEAACIERRTGLLDRFTPAQEVRAP